MCTCRVQEHAWRRELGPHLGDRPATRETVLFPPCPQGARVGGLRP